jgi:hypothetical protein
MSTDLLVMQGQVGGSLTNNDSVYGPIRLDKTRAAVVAQAHGKYREAVARGNVYIVAVKSATVTATTDISPLPATTGRALVGVVNPIASGVKASILMIGMSSVSGTPGGPFYIDVVPKCGVPASLAASSNPLNAGSFTVGGKCRGLAAAVPAQAVVGTMLRPLGGPAAIALGAGIMDVTYDIDGSIELAEDSLLAITAHATGTSHVVSGFIMYEEIPF